MERFKKMGIAWDVTAITSLKADGRVYWDTQVQELLHSGAWSRHFPNASLIHNGETILFTHNEPGFEGDVLFCTQSINVQGVEQSVLDEYVDDLRHMIEYAQGIPAYQQILADFQMPNPFYAIERFRLYQDKDGKQHLMVLTGVKEENDMENMQLLPLDEHIKQLQEFVPDKNYVPSKGNIRIVMLIIAVAFAALVFAMSRSGRVVEGPGMIPPDVEHDIKGCLYVQPVGKLPAGTVVAARAAYSGTLEMDGIATPVSAGDVLYHRFDRAGEHTLTLASSKLDAKDEIKIYIMPLDETGTQVDVQANAKDEFVPAMVLYPLGGTSTLRQDVYVCDASLGKRELVVDRMVNWGDGLGEHIKPGKHKLRHNYRQPGIYTVQLQFTMQGGEVLVSQTKLTVNPAEK